MLGDLKCGSYISGLVRDWALSLIMDRSYNGASAAYDKSIALKGKWGGDATDVELIRAVYEGLGYVDSPWHC